MSLVNGIFIDPFYQFIIFTIYSYFYFYRARVVFRVSVSFILQFFVKLANYSVSFFSFGMFIGRSISINFCKERNCVI